MDKSLRFVVKNPPVVSESFGDETVIVHLDKGTYYSIRGSALAIWNLINDGNSLGMIVDNLSAFYQGSRGEIENGVRGLIDTMRREGLIQDDGSAVGGSKAAITIDSQTSAKRPAFENPQLEKYTDVEDLLALDPIHEVDATGWPQPSAEKSRR